MRDRLKNLGRSQVISPPLGLPQWGEGLATSVLSEEFVQEVLEAGPVPASFRVQVCTPYKSNCASVMRFP